ncbi:MAG: UbiA-like polyprenyltransferase [Dissulfurimicrobium sp.]|uniref:UbiA-like polyprenyltransferase n=1 Tax=Dissulfurimicrobium TaxID=1769732 RepID=UPI001EDAD515|nr:UbiA-like polyprenyltransferase [Dissulfurimicrobium hydrothermale]UKL14304.1 putative 4-hydroxybenzoate polyprenyltransferase [Dissulfurimicrobium hydrothermale]
MTYVIKKTKTILEMIKFEHTVFALPFAFLGAFLAAGGPPDLKTSLWILVGMVGARTTAMTFNRIVDLPFDAKNPRTAQRALPRGDIRLKEAWGLTIAAAMLYFLSAYELNHLAFILSPFVLALLLLYSYMKRFTFLCHIFLGLSIGIAPTAGWIAVRGDIESVPIVLSLGFLFWMAGFDILYACLDTEFDRKEGLKSIPAAFGAKKAFIISRLSHMAAFILFASAGLLARLNWIYFAGVLAVFVLLFAQGRLVKPDDLSKMDAAFFNCNAAISIILFTATAISLTWRM